ncbi:MAG: polysaccharide biosynthesis/export family protein [Terriglobales bacterium]
MTGRRDRFARPLLAVLVAAVVALLAAAPAPAQNAAGSLAAEAGTPALPAMPSAGNSSGVIQIFGAAGPNDPIGPGDLLEVRVFNQAQLSGEARVGANGMLDLPFLGSVRAAGLTSAQLEQRLTSRYGELLRHPLVSVRVLQVNSRRLAITGEVPRPGVYAFSGRVTLLGALAMAGGIEMQRAAADIYLLHATPARNFTEPNGTPGISVDSVLETISIRRLFTQPGYNPVLQPGDTIEVPPAHRIFVTGDVIRAGDLPLRAGMTLAEAISEAGGTLPQANTGKVRILRPVPGQSRPDQIIVNLAAINQGKAPDVRLAAGDICVVPDSAWRNVGLAVLDFFSGAGRWRVQSALGVY